MCDEMDASIIRTGVDLRQTGFPHSRLREVSVHMKHKLIGIDLAKNVFQVCAVNQAGKLVFNHKAGRARLTEVMTSQELTQVAMEACSSAHYWGRKFERKGHRVILVPPQHVQSFVRGGKSDARDALAIVEAAQHPKLHPVPIKSVLTGG